MPQDCQCFKRHLGIVPNAILKLLVLPGQTAGYGDCFLSLSTEYSILFCTHDESNNNKTVTCLKCQGFFFSFENSFKNM